MHIAVIASFQDYIRKVKDNHYELDREAMIKEILDNSKKKEQKYCKIFSEKKIHDLINQIPISIVNRGALEDQPSFEEILISLDIDPKMSEKLVYGCIKALNIISNSYSYRILFQDIRIYSSQNGESQVILKIEGENLNEELGDDKSPIIQFNDGTYFIILNTTKITFQMAKNEEEFISILRKFRLE